MSVKKYMPRLRKWSRCKNCGHVIIRSRIEDNKWICKNCNTIYDEKDIGKLVKVDRGKRWGNI